LLGADTGFQARGPQHSRWPFLALTPGANTRSTLIIFIVLCSPEGVKIPSQPVVADCAKERGLLVTPTHIDASAGELLYLGVYGQPGLDVINHQTPGEKKISPSREASGLIMISSY